MVPAHPHALRRYPAAYNDRRPRNLRKGRRMIREDEPRVAWRRRGVARGRQRSRWSWSSPHLVLAQPGREAAGRPAQQTSSTRPAQLSRVSQLLVETVGKSAVANKDDTLTALLSATASPSTSSRNRGGRPRGSGGQAVNRRGLARRAPGARGTAPARVPDGAARPQAPRLATIDRNQEAPLQRRGAAAPGDHLTRQRRRAARAGRQRDAKQVVDEMAKQNIVMRPTPAAPSPALDAPH